MATAQKTRLFRSQINIPAEKRDKLVELLNQHVADLTDLTSQVKQVHWNVKGRNFYSLHTLTEAIYTEFSGFVDELAERATALGGYVRGTVRMAAEATTLPEYPTDAIKDLDHIAALVERFGLYANSVREAIERSGGELGDPDTADLFTQISRQIDMRLWFLEAHLQGEDE